MNQIGYGLFDGQDQLASRLIFLSQEEAESYVEKSTTYFYKPYLRIEPLYSRLPVAESADTV